MFSWGVKMFIEFDSVRNMTIIPTNPVTDKVKLDVRVTVKNIEPNEVDCKVILYWDKETKQNLIDEMSVNISANQNKCPRFSVATINKNGWHKIIACIEVSGSIISRGEKEVFIVPYKEYCLPHIGGAWTGIVHWSDLEGKYWNENLRRFTDEDWKKHIDSMHKIGMDTVVIQMSAWEKKVFFPSKIIPSKWDFAAIDPIEAILSQADKNGMSVFMPYGLQGYDFYFGPDNPDLSEEEMNEEKMLISELWERYGHHNSFYGWYASIEASFMLDNRARYIDETSKHCKALCPNKPVMIAPYYARDYAKIEYLGEILKKFDFDILAYQDGIGPGRVPMDKVGKSFYDLYEVHKRAGKHLWADEEIWRFENGGDKQSALIPAEFDEMLKVLFYEHFSVEKVLCYQYTGLFDSNETEYKLGGEPALETFRSYEKYYNEIVQTVPIWNSYKNKPK